MARRRWRRRSGAAGLVLAATFLLFCSQSIGVRHFYWTMCRAIAAMAGSTGS